LQVNNRVVQTFCQGKAFKLAAKEEQYNDLR